MEKFDNRYMVVIKRDIPGGTYVATIPELTGCTAYGSTIEEAAAEAETAAMLYVKKLEAEGYEAPKPHNELMYYRDHWGTVEYSETDKILYGKVVGVNGAILYEGETREELEKDFHDAVDGYIEFLREKIDKLAKWAAGEPAKEIDGGFDVGGYRARVAYDRKDKTFFASIPVLDKCVAVGRTVEQALVRVGWKKDEWIEEAKKKGRPIPKPDFAKITEIEI